MSRLDRYLLVGAAPRLLFGVLLYAGLSVLAAVLPVLEWVSGFPLPGLAQWFGLKLLPALVTALPVGLVLAVLLTFGALAEGGELLAMQLGGVGRRRLALPFVVLGGVAAVATLLASEWALPAADARAGKLFDQLVTREATLSRLARRSLQIDDFTLSFGALERASGRLQQIRIERWQERTLTVVLAPSGSFGDEGIRLFDYRVTVLDLSLTPEELEPPAGHPDERGGASEADDWAAAALERLVLADNRARDPQQSLLITTTTSPEELIGRLSGNAEAPRPALSEAARTMTAPDAEADERRRAAVLFHRYLSEAAASLLLLLLAVPLSLELARSRAVGFGLALVLVLGWYLLSTFGQLAAQTGLLPPWLGVWAADGVVAVGGLLLWLRSGLG